MSERWALRRLIVSRLGCVRYDSSLTGMAMGTASPYDYVKIKHVSGGRSLLRYKYYAQGRRIWQGPLVDFVWFDEEPPEDNYDE